VQDDVGAARFLDRHRPIVGFDDVDAARRAPPRVRADQSLDAPAGVAERFRCCKAEPREFNLGDCFLWESNDQPWVFNLATQERYWHARASYEAVEIALTKMKELANGENISAIAIPQIGTGFGGLSWAKVRAIIEKVFADWDGTLFVYETYVPGE
jgi:O-acetyl-ADP-ribose deacetylase (regulator of RNase III)